MVKLIFKIVAFAVVFSSVLFEPVLCQQTIDARGTAMAFSNAADTRGLEQVGLNPATLALPSAYKFEFNIFSLHASARNNSFSKSQYDKYFTTGQFLNEDDKNDILSSIADDGLRGDFSVRANTLSFYMPFFSLSLVGLGNGYVKLPEDLPELVLSGNAEEGRTYQIGDLTGDGWGGLAVLLSGAYPVYHGEKDWWNNVAVGATLKFIAGLATFEVLKSDGKLINFDRTQGRYYAIIDQKFEARTSEGGRGIGFDFGAIAKFQEKWTFGLTFLNAFGSINWTGTTEKHLISVTADSLAISETFTETPDSVVMDTDTTFAIDEFSTSLPKVVDLSAAYQALPSLLVTAEYEQGITESMSGTKKSRFALGAEFIPPQFPFTPVRTGFSLGGRFGASFAFGFGIHFRNWFLDLAYIGYGGVFPGSSKGISLAATSRLRF